MTDNTPVPRDRWHSEAVHLRDRSGDDPAGGPAGLLMRYGRLVLAGILVSAALILVIPAGRRVFWSSDEARFALLAQDILEHGHWLVADLRDRPYLNKPQLQFWAIAIASLPLGHVTELTAAIPTICSVLAAIAGVTAIATLLWGGGAGVLAGLILATAPTHFTFGHLALPDMMLGSSMVWALYWFLRAWRARWAAGPLTGFYLCVGLAVASKGPAGYAALGGAIVAVLCTKGVRELSRLRPGLGLLILALCAAPWLVPYHLKSRGGFESQVLTGHYATWYFHGALLHRLTRATGALTSFLPWSIFLVVAPWWWRRNPDEGRQVVGLWTLTLWLLLGFAGTSRARYLVPVYPLFALLTAEFVARGGEGGGSRPLRAAAGLFAVFAAVSAVIVLAPPRWLFGAEDFALIPATPIEKALVLALILVAGAGAYLLARRGAFEAMALALAVPIGLVLVVAGIMYPPRYRLDNDVRPLPTVAAARTPPGTPVIGHPDLRLSYDFYLHRPVVEVAQEADLLALLTGSTDRVVITSRERWLRLARRAGPSWAVLAGRAVGGREMVVVGRAAP
jgi:4-amino-4-deoxy-L-arabinose transferase-like glycosyltransferase